MHGIPPSRRPLAVLAALACLATAWPQTPPPPQTVPRRLDFPPDGRRIGPGDERGSSDRLNRGERPRGDFPGPFGGDRRFPPEPSGGSLIRLEGGGVIDEETVRTARETASHSTGTPEWSNGRGFEKDVFTFTRVIFRSNFGRYGWGGRTGWVNDYPDSDLNLSWRLQQLTALRVDPDTRVVKLTAPELFDFPFIYMVKPGRMELAPEQIAPLRNYLLNGGALLTDDTWGREEWENVQREIGRVLPGRTWGELPREHPLFHCVFKLDRDLLQVPPIQRWSRSGQSSRGSVDTERVYFRAWLDDRGRIMVLSAHNTDLGDGWEREGENDEYFHTFSEPRAYPMAVNIVFYLMTH